VLSSDQTKAPWQFGLIPRNMAVFAAKFWNAARRYASKAWRCDAGAAILPLSMPVSQSNGGAGA
jgi:hypothetical protein